ncbi:ras association domain-containing protein 2 isoform X1 [Zonotrichia albicollis]|uniref:ras association domain-containing protein 2 isoform X1 n=1 Tax=Zonotrichia albicollis TaxID=44394 RepID=UPI003D80C163
MELSTGGAVPCGKDKFISRNELLLHLKTYNIYYEGQNLQLRHREEEGELIVEGLLNISWGLRRPIRLQMQDDNQRIRPPPSSSSWHSGCNLGAHGSVLKPSTLPDIQVTDVDTATGTENPGNGTVWGSDPLQWKALCSPQGRGGPAADEDPQRRRCPAPRQRPHGRRAAAAAAAPLLHQRALLQPQDLGVHARLRLRHQRAHQQHHDHAPGAQTAAQQVQDRELRRGVCSVHGAHERREAAAARQRFPAAGPGAAGPLRAGVQGVPHGEGPGGGGHLRRRPVHQIRDAHPQELHPEAGGRGGPGSEEAEAQVLHPAADDRAEAGGDLRGPHCHVSIPGMCCSKPQPQNAPGRPQTQNLHPSKSSGAPPRKAPAGAAPAKTSNPGKKRQKNKIENRGNL